jgi:predicted phage terminase large subunit-like protein
MLTVQDINKIADPIERKKLKIQIIQREQRKELKQVRTKFLPFVKKMWPDFIEGSHHTEIADKFNKLATGELTRLIINMPPRHTKSEFASFFLPAWMIGQNPKLKIIQATHTAELAVNFGRKTKHLIDSPEYQQVFKTRLQEDSKAAGRWNTSDGGEYFAVGVQGAVTGRGADLLIIDDPHSEQDVNSPNAFDNAWEWYTSGPRQRLQPGGRIVLVMTRWSTKDLTQKLLNAQVNENADQWDLVEFPAIMPDDLQAVKASAGVAKWNAQYMQNPTSEEGALIKREWWKNWDSKHMPVIEHTIQSYDTAFLKKETADYSAITTWGVFRPNEDSGPQIILLDSFKDRLEFPELRRVALEQYKYWNPETVIIEAKASGLPLMYELRQMGIPAMNFTPSKGQDKIARVNAVSPMFEAGQVWAPLDEEFAQEMVEEVAAFPYGDHDDLVDSMTQALLRFRQGGLVRHPEDYKDDEQPRRKKKFYW